MDSIRGAHTIAGGSNGSRGLSPPPGPLTLTTVFGTALPDSRVREGERERQREREQDVKMLQFTDICNQSIIDRNSQVIIAGK